MVELLPPRVFELTPEQVSLAHAQQWYVLDYDDLDRVLRTDGLSQFGLPEVTVVDVERTTHAMTDAVIAGLAHRLIAEWPENDPVGPATVTLRTSPTVGDPDAVTTPKDRTIDLVIGYDRYHTGWWCNSCRIPPRCCSPSLADAFRRQVRQRFPV